MHTNHFLSLKNFEKYRKCPALQWPEGNVGVLFQAEPEDGELAGQQLVQRVGLGLSAEDSLLADRQKLWHVWISESGLVQGELCTS